MTEQAAPAAEAEKDDQAKQEGVAEHADDVTNTEVALSEGGEVEDGKAASALELEGAERPKEGDIDIEAPTGEAGDPTPLLPAPEHLEADSHPADALHPPDSPTTSLISSLRSQLHLLAEQAQQLNTKLVSSISRHADLEDQHFALQTQHEELRSKADELEKSKLQWEESMNTGLLVERSQIAGEMQRLAAGLVEEERRRGSAEERRWKVESEVDELAASLFDQANTMVAAERMGRVQAEDRLRTAEDNLAIAEAAVRDMQLHLQSMPASSAGPHGTGSPSLTRAGPAPRKYLSSHVPFAEFATFLAHLRALRPIHERSKATFPPPLITNLVAQPFIARIIAEDHDAGLRLDTAPDLNYFSRRNVSTAILAGDLVIEPVSAASVITATTTMISEIGCSLCGKPVFPAQNSASPAPSGGHFGPPPLHPAHRTSSSSGARFSLKPFFSTSPAPPSSYSPTQSPSASPGPPAPLPSVFIFRIARQGPATTETQKEKEKENRSYPLCRSGWCLERLRAICELWHFVRTGIIHVVWVGDDGFTAAPPSALTAPVAEADQQGKIPTDFSPAPIAAAGSADGDEPKKKPGWGLGFKLTEKSTGWRGAFSRSSTGTSSPPVSPGLTRDTSETLSPTVERKELGSPMEIKSELPDEDTDGQEKEAEEEKEPSLAEPEKEDEKAGEDPASDTLTVEAPQDDGKSPLSKPASELDTDDGASFSTPKGNSPELHGDETASIDKKDETPSAPTRDPAAVTEDKPSPPPIPRRAAERSKPPTPRETVDSAEAAEASETVVDLTEPSPVVPDESTLPSDGHEHPASSDRPPPPPRRVAPPLPPRHPKTPTMQVPEGGSASSSKAFIALDDESFEAKTWRTVIRLKEDIWKARVGVADE